MNKNNICPFCKKEKEGHDKDLWLHWECYESLREFVERKHKGEEMEVWTDSQKNKYLKEYLKEEKEVVRFT